MKMPVYLLLLLLISDLARSQEFSAPGAGFVQPEFLPVDEAFELSVARLDGSLQIRWLIHPGYYLYRDRFSFSSSKGALEADLPRGKEKFDEIFGDVEVFYDELSLDVPVPLNLDEDSGQITIGYQGCADAGLCYPPQKRSFSVKEL